MKFLNEVKMSLLNTDVYWDCGCESWGLTVSENEGEGSPSFLLSQRLICIRFASPPPPSKNLRENLVGLPEVASNFFSNAKLHKSLDILNRMMCFYAGFIWKGQKEFPSVQVCYNSCEEWQLSCMTFTGKAIKEFRIWQFPTQNRWKIEGVCVWMKPGSYFLSEVKKSCRCMESSRS